MILRMSVLSRAYRRSLVGDREVTGEIPMVGGGQRIPQPRRYVVESDRALKAASYFSMTAHLDKEEVSE